MSNQDVIICVGGARFRTQQRRPVYNDFGEEFISYTDTFYKSTTISFKGDKLEKAEEGLKDKVVQIVLWYLDSGCSKHMTGQRSQLINFVIKFMGTVRFRNDQVAAIMGYGDYQIGNDETPEFVIKFLKKVQVALNATVRNIRTDNGTEFVNQTLNSFYEDVGITHQTSVARTPQQNGVVEKKNQTLVKATRTMLIFSKAPLFLWAEAVATAYLKYLHVFGSMCYPTNKNEDLGKLKPKADIGIFIGYSPAKKACRIYNKRTRMIMETIHVKFRLVQNPSSSTSYVTPSKKDRDILFQPLFDGYVQPLPSVVSRVPLVVAQLPADTTNTPFSTIIYQDAPSASTSPTTQETQTPVIHQDPSFKESSSRDVIPSNLHQVNQPFDHLRKWTKDHPLGNVIGNPSRPVSTRRQLQTDVVWCYFDVFLTKFEAKNYKESMKESCWFDAM
ncbi:integrase, catalytic region, zinc finger, CCHC-type containing protein [Tanacetum coccineum]